MLTNKHGIRRKPKGAGKKWRPSPNDPAFDTSKKPAFSAEWKNSVGDLFKEVK